MKDDLEIIKTILQEFFEEESIDFSEKDSIINFPAGLMIYEDDCWKLSWDYSFTTEPQDIIIVSVICKVMAEEGIDFEIFEGFYPIIGKDDIIIDVLWDSVIWYKAVEQEMSYEDAKKQCVEEIMKNNKKENLH